MPEFKDLTGKTIGRLTFINHEFISSKRIWTAQCQCGVIQKYRTDRILRMEKRGIIFECKNCKLERRNPTLTGKIFGRLTVLKEVPRKNTHRWWLCRCECGIEKEIDGTHLNLKRKKAPTMSCGCLGRKLNSKWANTTQYPPAHALKSKNGDKIKTSIYHNRSNLLSACYNPKNSRYKIHGARGHIVCDLWRNGAKDFIQWVQENNYEIGDGVYLKQGKTIYSPENCFIMKKKEFAKLNNSVFVEWKGKKQSITDWSKELKCNYNRLASRLKKIGKYSLDEIMNVEEDLDSNKK